MLYYKWSKYWFGEKNFFFLVVFLFSGVSVVNNVLSVMIKGKIFVVWVVKIDIIVGIVVKDE